MKRAIKVIIFFILSLVPAYWLLSGSTGALNLYFFWLICRLALSAVAIIGIFVAPEQLMEVAMEMPGPSRGRTLLTTAFASVTVMWIPVFVWHGYFFWAVISAIVLILELFVRAVFKGAREAVEEIEQ